MTTADTGISTTTGRLRAITELAHAAGATRIAAAAGDADARLGRGSLYVTCLGQFKRGKSTLINALLERDLLPVGIVPVTSMVTIVRFGEDECATVRYDDQRVERVPANTLPHYVSEAGNPGNRRRVAVVDVETPSPILRTGVCLVDTPGVGSVYVAGTEATRRFVPDIDAVLLIVGIDPPITDEEVRLARQAANETSTMLVVLNKADKATSDEIAQACAFTVTTLAARLGRTIAPFVVSAQEARHVSTRDWARLRAALDRLGHERLAIAAGRRIRLEQRLLGELGVHLRTRRDALLAPLAVTRERLAALHQASRYGSDALRDLGARLSAHQTALDQRFDDWRIDFIEQAVPRAEHALTTSLERLPLDGLHGAAMQMARQVAEDVLRPWLDDVEPRAARDYSDAARYFADLTNDVLARLGDADPRLRNIPPIEPDISFRLARHVYFTSLMRLTGGGVVSALVARFSPRRARLRVRRLATAYVRTLLHVNASRVYEDFRYRVAESRRAIEGELRQRLTALVEATQHAITAADVAQSRGEAAVAEELDRVNAWMAEADRLLRQANAPGTPSPLPGDHLS